MKYQADIKNVIANIRFPLLLGIVLAHTSVKCDADCVPIYSFLHKLFSDLLITPCVPAFFFISGFLFFYNTSNFDLAVYQNKLKRRFWTLFIPYLFWNILVMGYYLLGHLLFPSVISADNYNIAEYTFSQIMGLFWDYPGGFPICYQFWYLRDLIIISLFTPIIYLLIKHLSKYVIILLLFLFIACDKHGMLGSCLLFATGSYFSIWKVDVANLIDKFKWLLLFAFGMTLLSVYIIPDIGHIHRMMIVLGIGAFLSLSTLYVSKYGYKRNIFDRSTFFIYGFHGFPIVLLGTTIMPRIFGQSDLMCILQYIMIPMIIVFAAVGLYIVMDKLCPKILGVITGNRK